MFNQNLTSFTSLLMEKILSWIFKINIVILLLIVITFITVKDVASHFYKLLKQLIIQLIFISSNYNIQCDILCVGYELLHHITF